MTTFSQALEAHLHARGWSQAELARRAGVKPQTVTHWLRNGHAPSSSALWRVVVALGLGWPESERLLRSCSDTRTSRRGCNKASQVCDSSVRSPQSAQDGTDEATTQGKEVP